MKPKLLLFLNLLPLLSLGQVFPYTLSVLNEPYSDLQNATVLNEGPWDDPDFMIPLGFQFEFLGSSGSSLYISPLLLGGALGFTNEPVSPQDLMIIYGSDITDLGLLEESSQSPISVLVDGEEGSRIAKIEWKTVGFYNEIVGGESNGNRVSFQCWIYEGSGDFEIRFGNNTIKQPDLVHDEGAPWIAFVDDIDIYSNAVLGSWFLEGDVESPVLNFYDDFALLTSLPDLNSDPYFGIVYRFTRSATGLSDLESSKEKSPWSLFPNPTADVINLSHLSEFSGQWNLQLIDMHGQLVLNRSINSSLQSVPVNDLAPGVYFAMLSNGQERHCMKFSKE